MERMVDMDIHLSRAFASPVKSCGLEELRGAVSWTTQGMAFDRHWMVVDEKSGRMVTQKSDPWMVLIKQRFREDGLLLLCATGMDEDCVILASPPVAEMGTRQVKLFSEGGAAYTAMDAGDAPAHWLSTFFGKHGRTKPVRLVMCLPQTQRRARDEHASEVPAISFQDRYVLSGISVPSMNELNRRLVDKGLPPADVRQFRFNFVFDGVGDAHAEDEWKTVQIGDCVMDVTEPVDRCNIPLVDLETGLRPRGSMKNVEPMATLWEYRMLGDTRTPLFGIGLRPRSHGAAPLGEPVIVG